MTDTSKLLDGDASRVDAVDRPATELKFVIRKAAASAPEIQVGDATPGNLKPEQKAPAQDDGEDAELADGSDLVQKIAKAVAAELAPGLDKLATAIENAGLVTVRPIAKAASKQAAGQDDKAEPVRKSMGKGLFSNIVFGNDEK